MSLFLVRWPDGDCSLVTEQNIFCLLDEIADPSDVQAVPLDEAAVHFQLSDDGSLRLHGFNEEFSHVLDQIYPELAKRRNALHRKDQEPSATNMAAAVTKERSRPIEADLLDQLHQEEEDDLMDLDEEDLSDGEDDTDDPK